MGNQTVATDIEISDSPVMESLHVVPQSGSQVSYAHLLLLQRSEVLLRLGSPDPMVVAAACVLHLTPGSTSMESVWTKSCCLKCTVAEQNRQHGSAPAFLDLLPWCAGVCPGCGAALWDPEPAGVAVDAGRVTLSPTGGH